MGYPMTYPRLISRNGLKGNYDPIELVGTVPRGLVAGDLRRLEKDQRDERHLSRYATYAGVTWEQADKVLEAFFTDFGRAK